MKTPLQLHPGAVEHYENAEAYESRYEGRSEDIEYYLKCCNHAATVLEYGAGAGRLTFPLARAGKIVTAVDASRAMISHLEKRRGELPADVRKRVTPVIADMRTYRTRKRFDVIVAGFHTVAHLYALADIKAFLERAYNHLRPGGRLDFDLPLPRFDLPAYDPIAQVRVTEMDGPSGPELLTLRCFPPQEMSMHLHYAGFAGIRLRSDYTSSSIDQETTVYTVSARRPE